MNIKNIYSRKTGIRVDTGEEVRLDLMSCPDCNRLGQPSVIIPSFTPEQKKKFNEGHEIKIDGDFELKLICFGCGKTIDMPFRVRDIRMKRTDGGVV